MTQDLIKRLRMGVSISRERNLNLDMAKIAEEAADALQEALGQPVPLSEWKKMVAENATLKADLEQTRVQLAGCGVAAMQNTEESKTNRAKPGDYGYSESYADVCRAVDREIALRERQRGAA